MQSTPRAKAISASSAVADALEDQRNVDIGPDPIHIVPIEGSLERLSGCALACGRAMALRHVAFAAAIIGAIDGEAYSAIAAGQRLLQRVIHPLLVTTHIELEELGVVGGPGDLLHSGQADRAQHVNNARTRCRPGRRHTAYGDDVLHRADWREDDWQLELQPEQRRAGVDMLHIAQHPWPERKAVEGTPVLVKGRLGFGPAHQVIPGPRREITLGDG